MTSAEYRALMNIIPVIPFRALSVKVRWLLEERARSEERMEHDRLNRILNRKGASS